MKAIIFPGQGAQYIGMGKSLYEGFAEARDLFDKIDSILNYKLSDKCFLGPEEELKDTAVQQLAILSVSLAAFTVLKKYNIKVDFLSGLSLGEYSCLYAAEVLSLEDVISLVKERSLAMKDAANKSPATMLAVIGLKREVLIEEAKRDSFYLSEDLIDKDHEPKFYLSNINSREQMVISLKRDFVSAVKQDLEKLGGKVIELVVSGGFHSPFMQEAKARLATVINKLNFKDAVIPIVSNVTAQAHRSSQEIKENLIEQLTATVLWNDCVEYLAQAGVSELFELGPSKVLKGLIRKINPQLKVINIEKSEDLKEIENRT